LAGPGAAGVVPTRGETAALAARGGDAPQGCGAVWRGAGVL